jgi:hypothetical protein
VEGKEKTQETEERLDRQNFDINFGLMGNLIALALQLRKTLIYKWLPYSQASRFT